MKGITTLAVLNGKVHEDIEETRAMRIGGVPVTFAVQCLAGRDRPYGLFTLRMSATYDAPDSAERPSDVPEDPDARPPARVFVYHRHAAKAPADETWQKDEFVCIADALDMDEIPPDYADDTEAVKIPFYRTDTLELCFRNADMMYECRDSLYRMSS